MELHIQALLSSFSSSVVCPSAPFLASVWPGYVWSLASFLVCGYFWRPNCLHHSLPISAFGLIVVMYTVTTIFCVTLTAKFSFLLHFWKNVCFFAPWVNSQLAVNDDKNLGSPSSCSLTDLEQRHSLFAGTQTRFYPEIRAALAKTIVTFGGKWNNCK